MADESIWKKEISFGRKRKADAPPEPEREQTGDESTSLWKKEISFGRKKKNDEAEVAPEPVAEEPPASEEETPTWTRAVSFGRKSEPAEPVAEDPVVEEPAPVVELLVAAAEPEHVSDDSGHAEEPVAEEPVAEEPVAEEPVAEEPVADEPAPVVELPIAAAEPEPLTDDSGHAQGTVPEAGPVWTKEVSFSRAAEPTEPVAQEHIAEEPAQVADEPVMEQPAPVVELPVAAAEPEAVTEADPVWTKEVSFSRAPEPVAEASAPEPEVAAVPAPAPVVHAPVTADELPPLPEKSTKKVPFWKKDISLGGGRKKEKQPKAERAPKQPKEKKAKAPKEPKERKPKEPKVKAAKGSRGAKRITGLKVGASQLAAARVANNGSAELLQIARTPLEPGIVVGGELRDPDALAEALKEFFSSNNLPKKGVRLGIANNRIGVRTFDISGIDDEKQLTNAIRFRAQETLPIPIDEAVLDFKVLGEGVDEEGQPIKRVLLVVAYRELIDRYMDACKKAGISLVGIDLEAFALLRALQAPQDGVGGDSAAALVAVAIGHDRSTFAVSDGRICEFTRVLEWGGAALNVAIARALDAAPSEVDGVKRALALTDEMVPEGLTEDQAKKARDAMRRAIQTFARELVSSLQYYQNQPGSLGIGEIVLTGGTTHLSGLAGELERLIGVRVRVGDPLARMKVSKRVGEAEQVGSLAVAIGLGIED
jgi:type IV pilus assembly protein PilM